MKILIEKYAKYYLCIDEALKHRMSITANNKCNPEILYAIEQLINQVNPFAKSYRMLKCIEQEELNKCKTNGKLTNYV